MLSSAFCGANAHHEHLHARHWLVLQQAECFSASTIWQVLARSTHAANGLPFLRDPIRFTSDSQQASSVVARFADSTLAAIVQRFASRLLFSTLT